MDHEKDIQDGRTTLLERLEDFRIAQTYIMTTLPRDLVTSEVHNSAQPETQKLLLPSDLSVAERNQLQLHELSRAECNFRVGGAHDALADLRKCVKSAGVLLSRKQKNCRGQDQNTQAKSMIDNTYVFRDSHIATYNAHRKALESLGYSSTTSPDAGPLYQFPELSINDTYRKPTEKRRTPGDSHGVDGRLWRLGAQASTSRAAVAKADYDSGSDDSGQGISLLSPCLL